jgi:UDP-2-acetamido-3-amino-2,3-dideoxy-glucuronate N-acetyltransferase
MKHPQWRLIRFTSASDARGDLLAIELQKQLPFEPKRFFATYNVPSTAVRGEHAHIVCEQVLFALSGSIRVLLDDGVRTQEFLLDDPTIGLYVPKQIWGTQESLSSSSILGVFASHPYEDSDYIRSFDAFLELVNNS